MKKAFKQAVPAFTLALAAVGFASAAEPFPAKSVRIIVPAAAGGGLDITTRRVARKMSENLGQPVIVENRPGGDSMTGTRYVKGLPADGYTLLAQANGFTAAPAVKLDPGYDPLKDFTAIGPMLRAAQLMYVGEPETSRTLADFVAQAKKAPGKLTFAHGGVTSPLYLGAAQFAHQAGLQLLPVPYKGSGVAFPDVSAGRVTSIFAGYSGGVSYMQAGKLRALGVTGDERMAALPNVPTFKEQGVNFSYYYWLGLLAPANTPTPVIQRLADSLRFATSSEELAERFRAEGAEPTSTTPEEFNAYLAKEVADTAALAKALNIPKD